jgi:hypothetical protein
MQAMDADIHAGRRQLLRSMQQGRVERGLAQAAGDAK